MAQRPRPARAFRSDSVERDSARRDRAGAVLTIDCRAMARNYCRLKQLCRTANSAAACAAVVKADGYGTGARQAVRAVLAEGCRHFFVAHLDEALAISDLMPADAMLAVLNGYMSEAAGEYLRHHIVPVINHPAALADWRALAAEHGRVLPAVLHVDTGMNRLGFSADELLRLVDDPHAFEGVDLKYIMSHLACADEPDHPMNNMQLQRLREALHILPPTPVSFANSGGVMMGGDYIFDLGRPGIALYGGNPHVAALDTGAGIEDSGTSRNQMENVVTLRARVLQLREVSPGMSVGYGASFRASKQMRTATIALGYADGFLRSLSGATHVYFNGVALPVIGRVSMDLVTIAIDKLEKNAIKPGDYVEILGANHNVDALARDAGTIGYEILTSLGRRYYREYII